MARLAALLLVLALAGAAAAQTPTAADRFADKPLVTVPDAGVKSAPAGGPTASRMVVSLCVVGVLIVGLGWAYKRMFAAQNAKGGGGAVTLVSRTMLTPRHQVFVLRVGHRLIVVGDSGHGMNRLGEITDPAEMVAVLGESGDAADLRQLRAGAFGAALDEASDGFERTTLPGGDATPVDEPPYDDSRGEVQSLIARVRGLAGQVGGAGSSGADERR